MREPESPARFKSLLDWCVQAWRFMRANKPVAGPGILIQRTTSGSVVCLAPRVKRQRPLRYELLGLKKDAEGAWRLRVGVGCALFNEIRDYNSFSSTPPKAKFCKAVFPTIDVGGVDVRIDDATKPAVLLGDRENGTLWLIVQDSKCYSKADVERLVITNRGKKPEAEKGEICVPVADFDVETSGEGEAQVKSLKNVYQYLLSDHQQPYLCDGTEGDSGSQFQSDPESFPDDSRGSGLSGRFSNSSGGIGGSGGSGSGSDDDGDDDECDVKARSCWVGNSIPSCLPEDKTHFAECVPKKLNVTLTAEFFRSLDPAFGQKNCTRWAFGVELIGGKTIPEAGAGKPQEYTWMDDWSKDLTFILERPPSCEIMSIKWRVKSFAAPSGPLDGPPFACCDKEWKGEEKIRAYRGGPYLKLPKVCGGKCQSCPTTPPP